MKDSIREKDSTGRETVFSRIVVAVDAFSEESVIGPERMASRLSELMKTQGVTAKLVYVLTPSTAKIPASEFTKWSAFYALAGMT